MDKIEVTQADIDEATSALSNIRGYGVKIGSEHSLVQAFARHRIAHTTRPDATPVAWMYTRPWADVTPKHEVRIERWATDCGRYHGWTETPLYPDPPATEVAALVEAAKASAEGWANAVEFNLLPVQHWQTANDLQRQLRQALTPFTKG